MTNVDIFESVYGILPVLQAAEGNSAPVHHLGESFKCDDNVSHCEERDTVKEYKPTSGMNAHPIVQVQIDQA
jgi:hypothetical protein